MSASRRYRREPLSSTDVDDHLQVGDTPSTSLVVPAQVVQRKASKRAERQRFAASDVDDLNSTTGGTGELLDVTAVGRDDCGAAAYG